MRAKVTQTAPVPTNSAWGTDPDQPITFDDYCDVDESHPDVVHLMAGVLAGVNAAIESANNGDWMGDDRYDDDGSLIVHPHNQQTPMVLQRARNPRLQRAFDRRRKVVDLKIHGYTFEDIALKLGYATIDGARAAFNRAMLDTRDVAEEYRDTILARNERMIGVLLPMADAGDIEAIDKIVKINAQTAKITRMDAIVALGHGPGERGETAKDVVERIQAVEDVNQFLEMLPNLVSLSPQPEGRTIDSAGNVVESIVYRTDS